MNMEEHKRFLERLEAAEEKIFAKVEKRLDENEKISSELLGEMSDIVKDMAKTNKEIIKSYRMLAEHKEDEEL